MAPELEPDVPQYVGQPVSVTVMIGAFFHWSGSAETTGGKHAMRYDVVCDKDSGWLVSGPKRGEHVALVRPSHEYIDQR